MTTREILQEYQRIRDAWNTEKKKLEEGKQSKNALPTCMEFYLFASRRWQHGMSAAAMQNHLDTLTGEERTKYLNREWFGERY